jgi:hypothetical protein
MPFQPEPVAHDPNRIVENVHALPGQPQAPDLESRQNMEGFLGQRIAGEQPGLRRRGNRWRIYDQVERTRFRVNWRATLIGAAALNIAVNLLNGNIQQNAENFVDDMAEEVSGAKDVIQDGLTIRGGNLCLPEGSDREVRTRIRETESFYFSANPAGESKPQASIIDRIFDKLEEAKKDSSVTGLHLELGGNTSDEWLGLGAAEDYGYGHNEAENEELGILRVEDQERMLRERAEIRGFDLNGIDIQISHAQHTLDGETLKNLQDLVQSYGFRSIAEAQELHNQFPDSLPGELTEAFDYHFSRNRDNMVGLFVTRESSSTVVTDGPSQPEDCTPIDGKPEDENHDYDWLPLPFLWLKRRQVKKLKGTWVDLVDVEDPQRLLIHRDGVHNRELDRSAWAYVRKFMYLFREDDRISKIFEHGYQDADGQKQSLRAIFVDHEPTEESVAMVSKIFEFASQIQGGRLGRECDAVVIYPRTNAGLHGDAKRVGLGMDVQYQDSVLGVAIPSLKIVEMHMPELPEQNEVGQDYNSAAWVIAHELAGHFSDVNDRPNRLRQVGHNASGKPVYQLPNRFQYAGLSQYRRAEVEQTSERPVRWRVRRGRSTLPTPVQADSVTHEFAGSTDPRLREAHRVKKLTGNPSIYGSGVAHEDERTAAAEAYAEAAANMVTGIAIPFAEAPEPSVRHITPEDPAHFIGGHDVSDEWNRTIDQRWGSTTSEEQTRFENEDEARQHWMQRFEDPENFDWAQRLAQWARSVEVPEPEDNDWVEIIVGQALKNRLTQQTLAEARAKRKILV